MSSVREAILGTWRKRGSHTHTHTHTYTQGGNRGVVEVLQGDLEISIHFWQLNFSSANLLILFLFLFFVFNLSVCFQFKVSNGDFELEKK